jgi:hypothetical protein
LRTLLDSGSLRSYIKAEFRPPTARKVKPITVGLGGEVHQLDERCDLTAAIDGLEFDMTAYVVEELGETEHGSLDAIVGALTLEEWYIKLDPRTGELDLSGLRKTLVSANLFSAVCSSSILSKQLHIVGCTAQNSQKRPKKPF